MHVYDIYIYPFIIVHNIQPNWSNMHPLNLWRGTKDLCHWNEDFQPQIPSANCKIGGDQRSHWGQSISLQAVIRIVWFLWCHINALLPITESMNHFEKDIFRKNVKKTVYISIVYLISTSLTQHHCSRVKSKRCLNFIPAINPLLYTHVHNAVNITYF